MVMVAVAAGEAAKMAAEAAAEVEPWNVILVEPGTFYAKIQIS